jgi:hypothetical protein
MRAFILIVLCAMMAQSCMSTHGCVGRANHNKKVAMKRHHYRATHRGSGNHAVSW